MSRVEPIFCSHQTTIMPAEILFPDISNLIEPATDRKGNAMAKSHYQYQKRQKELAKKKKKEEKRQRKLENKAVETDETEKDPLNGGPVSIGTDQHQLPELYNGNN